MSPLAVYAVVGAAPPGDLGEGVCGEPLRAVACGSLAAIVGEVASMPSIEPDLLERHDQTVRRLEARVEALLPARFGQLVADRAALAQEIDARAEALAQALELVAGRAQMTLRVFCAGDLREEMAAEEMAADDAADAAAAGAAGAQADAPPRPRAETAVDGGATGPGARFLEARRRAWRRAHSVPEIDSLREALAPLTHAERARRHDRGPLLASVYHLVARERCAEYAEVCRAHGPAGGCRVAVSGPWPPYAFVPGVMS